MRLALNAFLILLLTIPAAADYKIVIHRSFNGGQPLVETLLVQGARQRIESDQWILLYQCDKQQLVQLNPETHLYGILRIGSDGLPQISRSGPERRIRDASRYSLTTEETADRATLFGHPAWRVRDTIVDDGSGMKTIVDTWYIDLPFGVGCSRPESPPPLDWLLAGAHGKRTGSARRGFPVLTRSVSGWEGQRTEAVMEVKELTRSKLDPKLFEIPADYNKALDAGLRTPDTFATRTRQAWENLWLNAARFFFEK